MQNIDLDKLSDEELDAFLDEYYKKEDELYKFINSINGYNKDMESNVYIVLETLQFDEDGNVNRLNNTTLLDSFVNIEIFNGFYSINLITEDNKCNSFNNLQKYFEEYNEYKAPNVVLTLTLMNKNNLNDFINMQNPIIFCQNSTRPNKKEHAFKLLYEPEALNFIQRETEEV